MKRLKRTISLALAVVMLMSMMTGALAEKLIPLTWDHNKKTQDNIFVNIKMHITATSAKPIYLYKSKTLGTSAAKITSGTQTVITGPEVFDKKHNALQIEWTQNKKKTRYWVKLSNLGFSWNFKAYDYCVPKTLQAYSDPVGKKKKGTIEQNTLVLVTATSGSLVQILRYPQQELVWVNKSDIFSPTVQTNKSYVIESLKNKDPFKAWCLNPKGDSKKKGAKIIIWPINKYSGATGLWKADVDKPQYRFRLKYDYNTGFYTILNEKSKLPLDVTGATDAYGTNGTKLEQWESNNGYNQQFQILEWNDGYEIRSRLGTSIDLTNGNLSKGQQIQLWEPSKGNKNQRWAFTYQKS